MGAFAIVLVMGVLTFGISYHILTFEENSPTGERIKDFFEDINHVYLMAFGEYNTDDYKAAHWILFTLALIFIPLVMLNMLIAIMSDTFGRVSSSREEAEGKELNALILE